MKYERYRKMNKLNILFTNEYENLEEICCAKMEVDEGGIAKYLEKMNEASENKAKIDKWDEDFHTLNKCLHIYNVIEINENKLRKPQCTKQDIAWLKKFAQRVEKDSDSLAKLRKYEEMLEKVKEMLKKARPVAQHIAIGCGVTLALSAIFSKKKNKK